MPLWAFFFAVVALVLLAMGVGYVFGLAKRKRGDQDPEGPLGSVVGAVLGLLAFILAFTFGIASSRFDNRKQLLLDEVVALETAARRTELLPEPHRSASRVLLKRYVDTRVAVVEHLDKLPELLAESRRIHDELWDHAIALARADMNSDIGALYVEAINDVIGMHTARSVVALQYRIPSRIWFGLLFVTFLSMAAVGYQFGLSGHGNLAARLVLSLTFAAVVTLIADLDRATQGSIMVSQQPMMELQQRLSETAKPPEAP
jgi:hypothetical protein